MGKEQRSLLVTMLSTVSTKLRTIALQQSHSLSNIKLMSTMSSNLLFRQLFDRESCTYTYLLADKVSKDAVLIDPVIELSERDASLVKDLGLKLKYVMNTHVHADHITGTGRLKKLSPGTLSVISARSGGEADLLVKDGDKIVFGSHSLEVAETPGHTEGCVTYINKEAGCAFTGDTLLVSSSRDNSVKLIKDLIRIRICDLDVELHIKMGAVSLLISLFDYKLCT